MTSGFTGSGCAVVAGLLVTTTVSGAEVGATVVGVEEGDGAGADNPISALDELDDGVADEGELVAGVAEVVATAGVATGVGLAGGALEGVTSTTDGDAVDEEELGAGAGEEGCGSGAAATVSGAVDEGAVFEDDVGLVVEELLPPAATFELEAEGFIAEELLAPTVDAWEVPPLALLTAFEPPLVPAETALTVDVLETFGAGAGASGAIVGRSTSTGAVGVLTDRSGVATEVATGATFSVVDPAAEEVVGVEADGSLETLATFEVPGETDFAGLPVVPAEGAGALGA